MEIPSEIVESLKKGKCILFLGAMASAPSPEGSRYDYKQAPPSGVELSQRLAQECEYPYEDQTNLQRVSLYFQFRKVGGGRESLVKAVRKVITAHEIKPSPALHMLAALPFPIVITTNYDRLFDIALSRANTRDGKPKQPHFRVFDPTRTDPTESVPPDPQEEEDKPILLKLHGDIEKPESIVITEEDYIDFIQRMSFQSSHHPIHIYMRYRLGSWPVLFVGYSLKDYNLRLLFKTLRWNMDAALYPRCFSVDPYPDNLVVAVWLRGETPMVSFIEQDLWEFVPDLYKRIHGNEYEP